LARASSKQRPLRLPDEEVVAERRSEHEQHDDRAHAHDERPAARIVRVEGADLLEKLFERVHFAATFAEALDRRLLALGREQRELRAAAVVATLRLDDLQRRIGEPLGAVDVAHERGDARARLRDAAHLDARAALLQIRQIDAFRQHAHELVEHVDDLGPAALQRLDDLHARDQRLLLLLEAVDLLDLLLERLDLRLQRLVARLLVRDRAAHQATTGQRDERSRADCRHDREHELLAPPLAVCFAPRE
jgi:hypothetical protein